MKTLIDKIIDELKKRASGQFNESARRQLLLAVEEIKEIESEAEFEEIASLLMKYMGAKCHPHSTTIVTSTHAELLYGEKTTGKTMEYVTD